MINYQSFFEKHLNNIKINNHYREFTNISRICQNFPLGINCNNGKEVVIWCSNDYLGMGQNQDAIDKSVLATKSYGVGSGGTRNISGNHKLIVALEKNIANFHGKESALVFSSGFVANDSTIQAITKIIPDLVIFSDSKNHSSIISGISNAKTTKEIFIHNDIEDLERRLKNYNLATPKLIIAESLYSMDGDFGKVKEIINLAKLYNSLTMIDEVHAVGVYGATGAGLCQLWGIADSIDIIQGTFGKAFGVVGGYIAGNKDVIDSIRMQASGFIFSTSLPPAIIAATDANVSYLKNSSAEREKLATNVKKIKDQLKAINISIVSLDSHIISIKIGSAKRAKEISQQLINEFNIYIQNIGYPTVPINDARLRISASSLHSDEMICNLIEALDCVLNKTN